MPSCHCHAALLRHPSETTLARMARKYATQSEQAWPCGHYWVQCGMPSHRKPRTDTMSGMMQPKLPVAALAPSCGELQLEGRWSQVKLSLLGIPDVALVHCWTHTALEKQLEARRLVSSKALQRCHTQTELPRLCMAPSMDVAMSRSQVSPQL